MTRARTKPLHESAPPRAPEAKKRLATDERRAQLLKLGTTLFGNRSYDDLSIDDIAAEAGVSKGLLYHYFPTKRAFYVEIVRAAAEELLRRTAPDPGPPERALYVGLHAYLSFVEEHRTAYTALLRSGVGADQEVFAIVEATRTRFLDLIIRGVQSVQSDRQSHAGAAGDISPKVRIALRGFVGLVEAVSIDYAEKADVPREDLVQFLIQMLLHALASAAPA